MGHDKQGVFAAITPAIQCVEVTGKVTVLGGLIKGDASTIVTVGALGKAIPKTYVTVKLATDLYQPDRNVTASVSLEKGVWNAGDE